MGIKLSCLPHSAADDFRSEVRHQKKSKEDFKKLYSFIPDNYSSLEQVTAALREAGLESSNLIIGIDFTRSNEWTGKQTFNGRSLHDITVTNAYEKAISIIAQTLAPFDEDNLIPCYGFGDASTHDMNVFSFFRDNQPCHGLQQVVSRYREILPHLTLSGPTSFAPVIEASMRIVAESGSRFHVLVIVADGQVTTNSNTRSRRLSPQEKRTIDSIVAASNYPLAIVMVGVGDGPWDMMKQFDDKLPRRTFDNFQFVNFTSIMLKDAGQSRKEAEFALAALMEVPIQYKATIDLNILGQQPRTVPQIIPLPPPVPEMLNYAPSGVATERSISLQTDNERGINIESEAQTCPICLTNPKNMAFGCGHMACRDCAARVTNCPICRRRIDTRLRLYSS